MTLAAKLPLVSLTQKRLIYAYVTDIGAITFLKIYTERGDTGGNFTISVNDTGGKCVTGVNKAGGNLHQRWSTQQKTNTQISLISRTLKDTV